METLHGTTRTYRSIYSMVDQIKSSGMVIYGAGFWGKMSLRLFALFDVAPLCFCDDDLDKQGTCLIQGDAQFPIISLDEAAEKYPNAVYFAAATGGHGNMTPVRVMRSRLRERGLISEYSGFHPVRYLFLLEGGLEALKHPDKSVSTTFQIESFKNMVVSNHMGNSGSYYFNTLMNGHPNIVSVVGYSFANLGGYYQKRLQYLEGEELILEIASQMTPCFISRFSYDVYIPSTYRAAFPWLLNQDGQLEDRVYIDSVKFITVLSKLLSGRGKVSFAVLLKAIHAAYANSIDKAYDPGQAYWIYSDWHQRNYDMRKMDDLLSPNDFDRLEYWFLIREPVQHWFSVLNRIWKQTPPPRDIRLIKLEDLITTLSGDLGLMLEKTEAAKDRTIKIVRFEDAKKRTRATMQTVSKWMDIPFDEAMLNATVNGIPVYFPPPGSGEKIISSSDTTAVDRKDFSEWMTSYDIFRLNLAFKNFKKAYGYDCDVPDYSDFSSEFLQELYKHPFRFETVFKSEDAKVQENVVLSPEVTAYLHEHIANLFIGYMQKDTHELITDVIWPQETEAEE